MRRAIASVFFAMAAALVGTHVAQAAGFSYISRIAINGNPAGTCYNVIPAGYPGYDFSRQPGPCGSNGSPTPTPAPTASGATPTPVPTGVGSFGGGALSGVTGISFSNPASCGTFAAPVQATGDLTGCSAGYIQKSAAATSPYTYTGYTGPPIVLVTPINDTGNVIGLAGAPTANGFSLQSVSLLTGNVSTTDTSILSYLILGNSPGTSSASPITLQPSTTTVNVGAQTQLAIAQSGNTNFSVSSSNANVGVSISGSNVYVVGLVAGTSTITVTGAGGLQASTVVTVVAPVTVTSNSVTVGVGFSFPAILASQAGNSTFTAQSSNTGYATVVVNNGNSIVITGAGAGSGTITVTGAGGQTATINFTVPTPSLAGVTLNSYAVTLNVGGPSATVTASQTGNSVGYTPVSADATKVTTSASGSTITVNPVAQTSSPIAVTITGTVGSPTAILYVTVLPAATAATISLSPASQTLQNGASGTIAVAYSGSDALAVTSSNPSAVSATLASRTVTLSALAPTTSAVTITVTDTVTNVTGTATVSVNPNPITFNLVGNAVSVPAGQTTNFMAIQNGNGGTGAVFQTSSDASNIASVTNVAGSVAVQGVNPGTAHITVIGGGTSAVVTATVTAGGLSLSSSSITIVAGQQSAVTASQSGNTSYAFSATENSPNVNATTAPTAINNVIVTALVPTASTPAAVTVGGTGGATAPLSVTVLPAQLTYTGTTTVPAGSTTTFNVVQIGNPGSYTVATSSGLATATVQSENANGAVIAVTGNSVGNLNITVQGQGGSTTQVVVPFSVTVGPISISPNIGSLSLVAGTSSQAITISEPGWTNFSATVASGVTSVVPVLSGSQLVIQGQTAATNIPVTIAGENGSTPIVILVTVTAPSSSSSDSTIVSAIQGAGATAVWPMNDAVSGATSFANGISGGPSLTLSSGNASTATQAYPIVAGSSHSAFFNPLVGTATSAYVLGSSSSSAWTVGVTILPSSVAGTKAYEVWSAGEPFSGHTGVALDLQPSTGQLKLAYGVTSTYNTVTGPTIAASSGPASAFTQGHVIIASWNGTQFSLSADGGAPVVVTPSNTFASSTTPLSFANSTNTSAALAYLGYMQYPFYAPTALGTTANTAIYNAETGSSSTTIYPITFSPSSVAFSGPTAAPQTVVASQTGNTAGYTVQGYSPSGIVTATIAPSSSNIVISPQAAGSTSVTIAGGGTTGTIPATVATPAGTATLSITPSSASFAPSGAAQNFTIKQTNPSGTIVSSGFSIGTGYDTTCVTATIGTGSNANILTVTPKAITCSTSLTINGNSNTTSLTIKAGTR